MKPAEILRELAYPFTDMALLLAMIAFWLLAKLVVAAGLFGLWLALVITPAFFRYLLYVLEARFHGRSAPTLGGELFNWVENFWSLFPLFLLAAIIWGEFFLAQKYPVFFAIGFALIIASIFPASMAVLAMTRSPAQSLRPSAFLQLIRICRWDYLLLLAVVAVMSIIVVTLAINGLPRFMTELAFIYLVFLLFAFTGTVVARSGATALISIPTGLEKTADELEARTEGDRKKTLNHAYAFISRDNRTAGLAHIQSYIENSPDPAFEYRWFFTEMLNWESKDGALFFAQNYLTYLLDTGKHIDAMKVIARCKLENALFKPLAEDRRRALDAATQLGNDEMIRFLENL